LIANFYNPHRELVLRVGSRSAFNFGGLSSSLSESDSSIEDASGSGPAFLGAFRALGEIGDWAAKRIVSLFCVPNMVF
jgi:hypothetical protein